MCPIGVASSRSTHTLKTGEAKLWILLVGVNQYQDENLPWLRYPALDCQGLGEALAKATEGFPNKEVIIHHDFAPQPPTLSTVRASLQRIVSESKSQDTILLYFSGHGMLEPKNQQAILCMGDTQKDNLLTTGLGLQQLLQILGKSSANQQLLCLDTCHSGDIVFLGSRGAMSRTGRSLDQLNPTPQFMELLRKQAAQSKGFCALLSCDQGQQSWEFPELGHGLFTYYLMRGLLGEAADSRGVIEADGLYKYVYRQTLQYIDKINQQLRLINQQKRHRGESQLHPEYPPQTPKRIVEGVGELIVGFKHKSLEPPSQRRALVIDGFSQTKTSFDFSRVLRGAGDFTVEYLGCEGKEWSEVRAAIQSCIRWQSEPTPESSSNSSVFKAPTTLLYLRGRIEEIEDGESWLILGEDIKLSRSWLRQELRRKSPSSQQIIILDCPQASSLEEWVEDLQLGAEQKQCLLAAAGTDESPEAFSQSLLDSLVAADPDSELPVAGWIPQLQTILEPKGIYLCAFLSTAQEIIDIFPGGISSIFGELEEAIPKANTEGESQKVTKLLQEIEKSLPIPSKTRLQFLVADSGYYLDIQQLLMQLIGPIAPTLLKKALPQSSNIQELVENLGNYLSPEQKHKLEQQVNSILQKSNHQNSLLPTEAIDDNFLTKCESELVKILGPIANFMIQRALKCQPQTRTELIKKLVIHIPDTQQALQFEKYFLET